MKAMPLPFEEFQGKGVLDFSYSSPDLLHHLLLQQQQQQQQKWSNKEENWYVGSEPTSVLDSRRSPISSTMSSSLNGNGSTDTNPTSLPDMTEKCGNLGTMEDWESVLSESPNQEQSILRLIMGDVEDPSVNLNKLLQSGTGSVDFNGGGFGGVDQGFSFEQQPSIDPSSLPISTSCSDFLPISNGNSKPGSLQNPNPLFSASPNPLLFSQQHQTVETLDEKPQIFNPQLIVNQNQAPFPQNPSMFLPLPYAQMQEHNLVPPPPKRLNHGPNYQVPRVQFPDSGGAGQDMFLRRQQQQQQLQMLPLHLQQRPSTMAVPAPQKIMNAAGEELANHQLIIDQLFKASELLESGNPSLAQGILARLNHQLSPIGKAFHRAAFYFKEALQSILQMNNNNNSSTLSPFSLIFKIGAYKSFSEVSPVLQFANFTCNQAILEALERFDRIHIIDFDIGYGGQWASLMQELAMRSGGAPTLKITAFASTSIHDQVELSFTQDNLKHFATEINIPFEIEIVSLEALNSASWALPIHISDGEAIAVNLPINSFSNYPVSLPVVLRFVKQLSPKIVVSLDRGCDRSDVPFPHHMINALQSYASLLESLDAVKVSPDTLQKIERFLIQPGIEKIVSGRHRALERTPPWRSLFLSSGFTPVLFSNFTESQAECLVQRTPVRGFHFEKRQSSLVLCWQRKELLSASAWRC